MHDLLDVEPDQDISDVYGHEEIVEELVQQTGDEQGAAGMINWAANMNPDSDFWQDAQDYLDDTDFEE